MKMPYPVTPARSDYVRPLHIGWVIAIVPAAFAFAWAVTWLACNIHNLN